MYTVCKGYFEYFNVCAKTLLLQYVPYICYNKDLFHSYNILMYLFNSFILLFIPVLNSTFKIVSYL